MDAGQNDRQVRAASLGSFRLVPETGGITRNQGERTNIIKANASLARFPPILALFMASALILAFRSVTYSLVLGCVAIFSVVLAAIRADPEAAAGDR